MTRFAFTVEFDGRPFMGWQRQAHGPSVQQAIEDAIARVTGEAVAVHAAGRTDAGVHGLAMRAHADIDRPITPFRLMEALNARLRPHPVAILACDIVPADWHARFSCTGRAYVYRIANRRAPLTLETGQLWRIGQALDEGAMAKAATILVGLHDFTTFRSAHCQAQSPVKTLDRLEVERHGDRIVVHAEARSFLHHQVRSMVGCLALVGMGRWSADDLAGALAAKDRACLGLNAPPDGLYFVRANYPDSDLSRS
ncbi:MAG: tRNA pseudouridine(38-40) synthase TruA [Sphingobium sp.]